MNAKDKLPILENEYEQLINKYNVRSENIKRIKNIIQKKHEIDINKPDSDPEHMNIQKLIASRKKILRIADFIIPGHGKMFMVKR